VPIFFIDKSIVYPFNVLLQILDKVIEINNEVINRIFLKFIRKKIYIIRINKIIIFKNLTGSI
jgi:hypothetical protein